MINVRSGLKALVRSTAPGNPGSGLRGLFAFTDGWQDILPSGVVRRLMYDDGRDQGRALRTFRGSYLGGVTASPSDILIVGASFEEGHGTTLMSNGWPQVMRDNLRKLAQPRGLAGGGSVTGAAAGPSTYQAGVGNYFGYNPFQMYPSGLYPDSPIIATAGTFNPITTFGLGLRGIQALNGASFTIEFFGTGCDLVYSTDPTWGTFTWAVDGGGTTSQATTAANSSGNRVPIRGLTRGRHTVQVITTAAGSGGQGVQHEGAVFYDGDETSGIRVWQAAKAGAKAMDFVSGTGSTLWVNSIQTWNVPDLCIINLGYNDIWASSGARTAAQVKTDLQSIITLVKNRCTTLGAVTPSFVLMSSFNVNPGGSSAPVDTWDNAVKAIQEIAFADDDVCVFDYQHWFGKESETSVSTRGGILVADGLHPTDGGAAIIGGAMANFVLDSSERMRDIVRYGTSIKGSLLPASTGLADTDALFGTDGTVTEKYSLSQLTSYFESRARQHNASVTTQVTGAVDVYITNSDVAIPQTGAGSGRLQAKSKYQLKLALTKGAAGTGTPTFNVRIGTAGALADTSRLLFTWPAANTAVADEMFVEIMCTIRTVGATTTAVIEGQLVGSHELTATGFGGTGLTNVIILNTTSGGFDSTVANLKIGVSVNAGTAGAWSIRQAQAVLENLA